MSSAATSPFAASHAAGRRALPRLQTPVVAAPVRRCKPPLNTRGVMALLDCTFAELMAALENGKIRHVFNVASRFASKRELRFFSPAVADAMAGRECALGVDEVLGMMLPRDKAEFRTPDICRVLNVDPNHTISLIRERSLIPCSETFRRGRGQAASVLRGTLEAFLRERHV